MSSATELPQSPGTSRRFVLFLAGATVLGVAVGWACHALLAPAQTTSVAQGLAIITEAFLRLIRMIIAPLVFASLVPAIARMQGAAEVGRIGVKTLLWFVGASCVSLAVGLLMAHVLRPGAALHTMPGFVQVPPATHDTDAENLSAAAFMRHLIPGSIVEAMGNNEILQIVVFSMLIGVAAGSLKERAGRFVEVVEQLAAILFRVTDYVMRTAPLAMFAALAGSICVQGIGIVSVYARFVGGFYLSLCVLWALLIIALTRVTGSRGLRLLASIRQPVLLAFATSSSEAAYPRLFEALTGFGLPSRIASFVLPLGYSFNLDGAMMYATFAVLFIAQAYGVELSGLQQISLFGLLMITTKGLAGVPRAVIAVLAVTLHDFHLPDGSLALVLAVDHLLDMGRAATNVVGNAVATAAIASWEGQDAIVAPIDHP